jgi:hypothetical protein
MLKHYPPEPVQSLTIVNAATTATKAAFNGAAISLSLEVIGRAERAQQAAQNRQARLEDRVFATPAMTPCRARCKGPIGIIETEGMDEYAGTILEHLARDAIALASSMTA